MSTGRQNGLTATALISSLWPPPKILWLWGAMWLNLNTGPWLVPSAAASLDWVILARVYAPYVTLPIALLVRALTRLRQGTFLASPLTQLALYGLLGLTSGLLFSPRREYAVYWGAAYLATVVIAQGASSRQRLANAFLLYTLVATAVVAAGVTWRGRGTIFSDAPSAYHVITELEGRSRSSGVGRWAGVAVLTALSLAFGLRGAVTRVALLAAAVLELYVVYRVQSRGAACATLAGAMFLLALERKRRYWAIPLLVLTGAVAVLADLGRALPEKVIEYLQRGGSEESLTTLGGRTRYWEQGWYALWEVPLSGGGFWYDRLSGIGHIHNGPLEAGLTAGLPGLGLYASAWVSAWSLFARLWRRKQQFAPAVRQQLSCCGAILTFFTLRAVPETTGAAYEPDLLVLAAVFAYLEALYAATRRSRVLVGLTSTRVPRPLAQPRGTR